MLKLALLESVEEEFSQVRQWNPVGVDLLQMREDFGIDWKCLEVAFWKWTVRTEKVSGLSSDKR